MVLLTIKLAHQNVKDHVLLLQLAQSAEQSAPISCLVSISPFHICCLFAQISSRIFSAEMILCL